MKYQKYPSRDAVTNYFPMPKEIFYFGLNAYEIAIYCYLMYCEDRKTYTCYPSMNTIARALRLSRNTIMKYVNSLEEKHLITTQRSTYRNRKYGKENGNLLYRINPVEEVKNYQIAQQIQANELRMLKAKVDKRKRARSSDGHNPT